MSNFNFVVIFLVYFLFIWFFPFVVTVKINLNPVVEERPKTPVLEITAVQSIPLDVYETPNGAAAAVSEDYDEKVCSTNY